MKGLALLLVLGTVAGAASPRAATLVVHPTSSIGLNGNYGRLAADGRRVAAVARCGIVLWSPGRRKGTFVQPCRPAQGVDFSGTDEVALAGNRLAWMRQEWTSYGLRFQTELVVKTGSGKPREIANAFSENGYGGLLGTLAGDGDTLAFGWAHESRDDANVLIRQERVFRIARTSSVSGAVQCPQASGLLPNPPAARSCLDTGLTAGSVHSVSNGRILVSFGEWQVGVVERDNREHDLDLPYREYPHGDQLALAGRNVIHVRERGSSLDVYEAKSGSLVHRWPLKNAVNARRLSVAGGFAVFATRGVHLVRLSNGSERTLLAPGGKPLIAAALEPSGLFILYRTGRSERLGFVPRRRLRAA